MKMPGNSGVLVRELLGYGRSKHCAGLVHHHLMLPSSNSIQRQAFKTLTLNLTSIPTTPSSSPHTFLSTSLHSLSLENFRQQRRLFSSSSASGPSNVILLNMYPDFYFQLNTVDEESLSAVFYFTTDDKDESNNFVTPILIGLGEQFPHVRIYKRFTEEGQSTLGPFDVSAAPIFFFLREGVKVAEIVGVDIARLKETFGKLYSREESQDGGAARDMKCSSGRSKRAATRARKDDKDSSRIALIKSNAQFHKLLRKVKVESLPAVFFFSTAYDDSCARIAPSVRELSVQFPHVMVNKIGLKEVDSSVCKFNVRYLPTFIFFQNGKKVCEIIGAEVAQLKNRFAKYYRCTLPFLYDSLHSSDLQFLQHRTLTSPSGPSDIQMKKKRKKRLSNIVTVKTRNQYYPALCKVRSHKAPVVFFFTTACSDACPIITPVLQDLSEQFPHVTIYKFDVFGGKIAETLSLYVVPALPTFFFYKDGGRKSRIIGADVAGLKNTFEKLYSMEGSEDGDLGEAMPSENLHMGKRTSPELDEQVRKCEIVTT